MNIFDRAILALVPDRLLSRVAACYEGARWTVERSNLQAGLQSAKIDANTAARSTLVGKSRYFERNNALQNRLADLFESYVAGCGLVVQPASSSPAWNDAAREWFDGWSRFPDETSLQSFGTLQGLMARNWFIDGEAFVQKVRSDDSRRPRIQLIEGHRVETPAEERDKDRVVDGIVMNSRGRPAGYWIAEEKKTGQKTGKATLLDAANVTHLFEPSRPGMIRGLPFCTPVINDLHDLDDLQLLEMRACKEAADITKVIESATGEMNIENVRKALVTNSKTLSTAASVNETTAKYYADVVGNRSVILRPGDKFNQFTSGRPSVATKEYWKYLTDKICAGVGIPSVLVYPESMQGTVYRGALDMATAWFRARSLVLADVVREIYVYVMGSAIVTEPSLAGVPKDWAKCSIRPPRAPNVDVGRNSQAMIAELAAGTTNWDIVYGAQGLDWREEFAKLAEQQQAAEALGLKLVLGGAEFGMPEPEEDVPAKKGSAE